MSTAKGIAPQLFPPEKKSHISACLLWLGAGWGLRFLTCTVSLSLPRSQGGCSGKALRHKEERECVLSNHNKINANTRNR